MRIDEELGMKIDLAASPAEHDRAFRALADAASARAASITGSTKEAAFRRGRMHGAAKAFRAAVLADERRAAEEWEIVIG